MYLMIMGCSGSADKSLTVDEYAEWCAGLLEDDEFNMTWGEFVKDIDALVKDAHAISPPDVLETYHLRIINIAQTMRDLAEEQEAGEVVNPSAFFDIRILGLIQAFEEVEAGLPNDVRERLIASGCVDEDDES